MRRNNNTFLLTTYGTFASGRLCQFVSESIDFDTHCTMLSFKQLYPENENGNIYIHRELNRLLQDEFDFIAYGKLGYWLLKRQYETEKFV